MEYGIRQLAELAGVSTRTLRYYDQIGLLHPSRVEESGHRLLWSNDGLLFVTYDHYETFLEIV